MVKSIGLWLGLVGFGLLLTLSYTAPPDSLTPAAVRVAAVTWLMAVWWVTECIPIPATSLLPLVFFPLLGISSSKQTAVAYAHHFILLLMGGFFVALTLERWNLHKRIALNMIMKVGTRPDRLILGFMLSGALLSMWISNTATTLMMLPIAIAVIQRMEVSADPSKVQPIGIALLLGVAYACNVGGLGTPIGTPPNLIYMSQHAEAFPNAPAIGFLDWVLMALPIVAIMIVVIWLVLTRLVNRIDTSVHLGETNDIQTELNAMGALKGPEAKVLAVFVTTALLWIFRKPITLGSVKLGGWSGALGVDKFVDDGTVALAAAVVLFLLPAGKNHPGEKLLNWETAVKIPWGLLLLFGGGLALADGFKQTGLSAWVGHSLAGFAHLSPWMLMGVVCFAVTFLTEVTSNTATTTILMPVFAAVCQEHGIDPNHLMLPAALSASCAFMLPVATAPNAIVFGTGRVRMKDMVKCGVVINLIGIVVITALL